MNLQTRQDSRTSGLLRDESESFSGVEKPTGLFTGADSHFKLRFYNEESFVCEAIEKVCKRQADKRSLVWYNSGRRSNRLFTAAANTPPRIGASQNNHNCCIAHPPAINAGPVLRAGVTETFVTGIPMR